MSNIKMVKFENVADFVSGQSPESKYYSTDSTLTPFMQGNRTFGRIFPIIDTYTSKVTKIAKEGDILISVRAPVGDLNLCNREICIGRGLGAIRGTEIKSRDLYFVLKNSINNLIKKGSGSTFSAITKNDIENMELLIPQNGLEDIGNILWKIENKILINEKINDNLSNMAQDIYMHYFFKKSPNGKLNDILFEANKSKVQVGDAKNCIGQYPFFTSGASILTWNEYFVDGRYCFLNTGGNADVKFHVGKSAYSTDTWCIYTNNNMTDYIYLLLLTLKEELNKKYFQGTGLKHLQKDMLKDKDIYIPTDTELFNFNNLVKPLFDNISKNIREIDNLVKLRDFLLPLLMNGQATIE